MTKPPKHLSAEMAAFWRDLTSRYEFEAEQTHTLQLACEAYDRATAAREQIDRDGMVVGGKRHPLLGVEAKSTELFYRGIKELGLEPADAAMSASEAGRAAARARWNRRAS